MEDSNRAVPRSDAAAHWRAAETWLLPLLPALLAGAHLTGLLLFLNPRVEFTASVLVRGTGVYGALLSPLSLVAHLLAAQRARVRVRRLLPWSLTLVAAAGALGDWVHASYYSYYLPPGINVQMIKTALWLTLGALLIFYTALLHSIHARRYGPRSRWLVLLVGLGTVYAMFDRRASFRDSPPPPPRLVSVAGEGAPRLAWVALPTATLDAVLPLAEQGKLPFFSALLENGAFARLRAFAPARPGALEATLATGRLPFRHGLESDRLHLLPWLAGREPLRLLPVATAFERWGLPGGTARASMPEDLEAASVWRVLLAEGRQVTLAGLPPALAEGADFEDPPVARGSAERELEILAAAELARELARDRRRLAGLARRLEGASPEAQAGFVRLQGLEVASRAAFGAFAAAQFEGTRGARLRRAADGLATYYAGLDAELAELWSRLPEPRLLVVVSAYGVSAPAGLRRILDDLAGREPLEGSLAGGPDGLLLLRGEGVRQGVQIAAAEVTDVAPTLLYALGLPIARDLDGKVLAASFEPALLQRRPLTFVPSYEGLAGRPAPVSAP